VRILFWGTPEFAVPALRSLCEEGHDLVGVVTQPDRPAGRGRGVAASPVKQAAGEMGVPILQPERARGDEFLAQVAELRPDLSVVVAYGQILKPEVLAAPGLAPSTSTRRSSPSCGARRRSSGPWCAASRRPASPSCGWRRGSIPAP
jgi:hypothetical protein